MLANTPEGRPGRSFSRGVEVCRGQIPIALLERHTTGKTPTCVVYCRRVTNTLTEKFAANSGRAEVVAEAIVSSETLNGVGELGSALVLSLTEVLAEMRGEWGVGGYYSGGWDIQVDAVKAGGLQYIQTSKVVVSVDIRRN